MPAVRRSHEEMLERLHAAKEQGHTSVHDNSKSSVHDTSALSRHTPRVFLSPAPRTPRETGTGATPNIAVSGPLGPLPGQQIQAPVLAGLGYNAQRVLNTSATLSERSISHLSAGGGSNSGALSMTPRLQEPGGGGSSQTRIP